MNHRFNVRVYFILFNAERTHVLISDEWIGGRGYTKFPGGGLEWGEGPMDCAKREALEELGQEITNLQHFYTTGEFIQSRFRSEDQVICIYYLADLARPAAFRVATQVHDYIPGQRESFRWTQLTEIDTGFFDFPADQAVALLLRGIRNKD